MDYKFNDEFYSIWTYKSGDIKGEYGTKQNLQFDNQMAIRLVETLEEFINN